MLFLPKQTHVFLVVLYINLEVYGCYGNIPLYKIRNFNHINVNNTGTVPLFREESEKNLYIEPKHSKDTYDKNNLFQSHIPFLTLLSLIQKNERNSKTRPITYQSNLSQFNKKDKSQPDSLLSKVEKETGYDTFNIENRAIQNLKKQYDDKKLSNHPLENAFYRFNSERKPQLFLPFKDNENRKEQLSDWSANKGYRKFKGIQMLNKPREIIGYPHAFTTENIRLNQILESRKMLNAFQEANAIKADSTNIPIKPAEFYSHETPLQGSMHYSLKNISNMRKKNSNEIEKLKRSSKKYANTATELFSSDTTNSIYSVKNKMFPNREMLFDEVLKENIPHLKKSTKSLGNYKYSIKNGSNHNYYQKLKLMRTNEINSKYFPKTYSTEHVKKIRKDEKDTQEKNYVTVKNVQINMLTDGSQNSNLSGRNLTDLNHTADLHNDNKYNDSINVQVFSSYLKNILNRQEKDAEKKLTHNVKNLRKQKNRNKESFYIVMGLIGVLISIGVIACIAFFFKRNWNKNTKMKKPENLKDEEANEDGIAHKLQGRSSLSRKCTLGHMSLSNKHSVKKKQKCPTSTQLQSRSLTNFMKNANEISPAYKKENVQPSSHFDAEIEIPTILQESKSFVTSEIRKYDDGSKIGFFRNREEKPVSFEDRPSVSRHESIESEVNRKCVRSTSIFSTDVSKSYSIKKPFFQDINPQIRSDFNNIILNKTSSIDNSNDFSDKSSDFIVEQAHKNKKSCLNLEKNTAMKKKSSSDYFNNNMIHYQDKIYYQDVYKYVNSDKSPSMKSKNESNGSKTLATNKVQHYLGYESNTNLPSEKFLMHHTLKLKSCDAEQQEGMIKQSKDNIGRVFYETSTFPFDSDQYLQSPSCGTKKEGNMHNPNTSNSSKVSCTSAENKTESPWERLILNFKPLSTGYGGKHLKEVRNNEKENQLGIAEESKHNLNSNNTGTNNDEHKETSLSASYQPLSISSGGIDKDIRNKTLELKCSSDENHRWEQLLVNLKKTNRFKRPIILTKFML